MIGTIISNYKIISVIGEGGMGIVYLAEHIHLNKKAAVKSLHKKLLSNHHIRERFKNEAATLSQIEHPNIVKLYDYVETGDGLYLIMEYVDGVMLDDFIKRESGPIKEENAVRIMLGLLSGFSYAHSKNIVHRDVKPSNVIISRDFSVVKILDFGIAKILDDDSRNLTKDGTQMGTVYYMSPEQVKGTKLDYRSDIYSLGVTFFQMITGVNPYENITSEFEIYNMITQTDLPKVKSVYPFASDKIENIIIKATRKKAEDRYQSCNQMISDLTKNQPKPEPKNIPRPPQPLPPVTQPRVPVPEEGNGMKLIAIGIGVIIVLFLLGLTLKDNLFNDKEEAATEEATEVATEVVADSTSTASVSVASEAVEDLTPKVTYVIDEIITNSAGESYRYTGQYSDNTANGIGTATYTKNGDVYKGNFINGLKEGSGTYYWNDDKSRFEGQFKNNVRNGFGTFYDVNNIVIQQGDYLDGKIQ